jgi:small-conductance mechanosensitive channel
MQQLDDAGIEIPFPQRDLHVRSIDPNAADLMAASHPLKLAATDENDLDAFPRKMRGSTRTTGD